MNGEKKHLLPVIITLTFLTGLLIIQFVWIWKAAEMQERQFSKSVDRALYRITESISKDKQVCNNICSCFGNGDHQSSLNDLRNSRYWQTIDSIIKEDLQYHEINLEYDFKIIRSVDSLNGIKYNKNCYLQCLDDALHQSGLYLSVKFPNKWQFVIAQIGPVFIISIIFILLITASILIAIMNYRKAWRLTENTRNFIDNMVHEFKTPLSNITFANNRIKKNEIVKDSKELAKYNEIIEYETSKMNNQVEEFLRASSAPYEKNKIAFSNIDLHEIIINSVRSIEDIINDRKGNIKTVLEAKHSIIRGEYQKMLNVLDNILDNALKYTVSAPEILIRTKNDHSTLYLSITDNGIGINKEHKKNIFNKYYRVPTGNIHNIKGYGLGLFYVKTVIDNAGGKIQILSNINKGTEIIISFPLIRNS